MTPLLLLHAFPFDSGMFTGQTDALESVAKIFTPDLPGFGVESAIPGISVDEVAEMIATMLNRSDFDQAVIGGVSMGGYVAMAVARRHPDRVKGLILADTRAEPDDDTAKANRLKAIETVQTGGVSALVDLQLPKMLSPATQKENPELVDRIRKLGNRQSNSGVIEAINLLKNRPDARPGLAEVTCPTLIIVGEDDLVTPPAAAETMKSLIPHSTLVRIPHAGHLANWEQPEAFNSAVRAFLNGL